MTTQPTRCPVAHGRYPVARGSAVFGPPAQYGRWREEDGLTPVELQDGTTAWLVTRYDYFRDLLADPRISNDPANPGMPIVFPSHAAKLPTRKSFRNMDDPAHRVLRSMVQKRFNAPAIDKLRPAIGKRIDELLDTMTDGKNTADLMSEFSYPLPMAVICDVLGIPYADHTFFKGRVDEMFRPGATAEEAEAAGDELSAYVEKLAEAVKGKDGEDIMTTLVNEQLVPGKTTISDIVNTVVVLLIGGLEAVASTIGGSVILLSQNPDQRDRISQNDPKAVTTAVDELLRYITPTENGINRTVVEDFEYAGVTLHRGDGVVFNAPTANRDPRAFAAPETLDLATSHENRHVAFGWGIHQCIGQTLAQAELVMALPALYARCLGLELTVPVEDLPLRPNMQLFGVRSLPVRWS